MNRELQALETLIGQLDYLFQEGVAYTIDEKAKFIRLFEQGLDLIAESPEIKSKKV